MFGCFGGFAHVGVGTTQGNLEGKISQTVMMMIMTLDDDKWKLEAGSSVEAS